MLQIGAEDEDGFERAKDWLLDGLGRWLLDERKMDDGLADIVVSDAEIALDWKFGYEDGHLGEWTTGQVTEFLLRWCPRKLSVSQEDSVTIPGSIAAFTDYLAERGLLARGSSTRAALRAAATAAAADFVAEMGNPDNFGMAKSLFSEAAAHGYDLTDEASVAAWVSEFNSLGDDERESILPGRPADARPNIPSFPPVVLPSDEAVEESRASAPVLAMFAKLAEFVGTGRRLTQSGNLSLADARELVRLLGTGDPFDERVDGKVYPIRTSVDLPVLHLVFTWAKKARVVRLQHGKVLATKRGLALSANPSGLFDRALDALLEAGPATAQRHPKAWPFWPDVDLAIDEMVLPLLTQPYVERGPVPLAGLIEAAAQAILKIFTFGTWSDRDITTHVGWTIAAVMDALELAGVVRRAKVAGDDDRPAVRQLGGEIELTPAGLAAVQRLLVDAGFDAPAAGQWASASAEEMLNNAARDDWISFSAEIDAWRQRREPEQALAELATAARHVADPGLQNIALTIMSDIGPELAAPYVRDLAGDGPAIRGFALCWLADHSMLDAKELYDPGDLEGFAYVLAHRLVTAGTDGVITGLAIVGGEAAQTRVVGDLGRIAAPPVGAVLEAIGRAHPAKPVAKAARKSLFVMRSRFGLGGPA